MIRFLIKIYIFLIIGDAILSYFPDLRSQSWYQTLRRITEFTQKPIRKMLPPDLPFDPTPIIVIVLLNVVMALW